jgi:hypothetical protein
MIYMVVWLRRALNELTTLWTNADSTLRRAITSAADEIDRRLKDNPDSEGESRADGERILFAGPLGILYHVKQGAVLIFHVWDARRKKRRKR